MTSTEWAAPITGPMTAVVAAEALNKAIEYAEGAIGTVMDKFEGTAPPARSLMPDLYKILDDAKRARDGVQVIADRTPQAELNPAYIIAGKNLGTKLIDESNRVVDKASKGATAADVAKALADAAGKGIGLGLKLGAPIGGMVFWGGLAFLAYRSGWFGAAAGGRRRRLV